jgi:hypothetical protein
MRSKLCEKKEGEEEALSQAVETILVTTRTWTKTKATSKAKDAEVEKALKWVEADVRGGGKCRHICGSIHRAMHQNTKAMKCEYHRQCWIN